LLQTAAVIGKSFPDALLRRVAGVADEELADGLQTLRLRDLVYEQALFPKVVYAFKHPLTQEVAYGSQLAESRRVAHAAVARVLEEKEPTKREEYAALLSASLGSRRRAAPGGAVARARRGEGRDVVAQDGGRALAFRPAARPRDRRLA